ncbi:hypothetical protein C5167_003218 [Papaver somniferum]|uniref:Uncharacterized protein n=1 Tax=Papaver somniferum TaxID=3469 RepID=A0A4Y7L418_PAPSO|nr:hypothetical protein C5167_003218 [Papaver somniferum]
MFRGSGLVYAGNGVSDAVPVVCGSYRFDDGDQDVHEFERGIRVKEKNKKLLSLVTENMKLRWSCETSGAGATESLC